MNTSDFNESEKDVAFWAPGMKTYCQMIRMEPKEAAISIGGAILIVLVLLLLCFLPCFLFDPIDRTGAAPGIRQQQFPFDETSPRLSPDPLSPDMKKYFKYRLAYHGLDRQVSVVYDFPERPYFERDGKICQF